jgi:Acetyltransferase (GNAT) domain
MITVKKYEAEDKNRWDNFIELSKNGVFIFNRDYMEYHSDRFEDHSLMFFKNRKLVAVMPANMKKNSLNSHDGLTFGGIISNRKMTMTLMLEIFSQLKAYLKRESITKVLYKSIPHIYHSLPAEEDLYALKINRAKLIRRDISSTIYMGERIPYSRNKKRNLKNMKKTELKIVKSDKFENFMIIEEKRLAEKYGVKPTHTGEEITLLASRFPNNIKLFTVEKDEEMYGGVIIFESKNVAHAQYQAATDDGLKLGGTDLIFDFLINDYYKDKRYFDFGISTEKNGLYLNEGLISYKEQFGARAVVQDFYEFEI